MAKFLLLFGMEKYAVKYRNELFFDKILASSKFPQSVKFEVSDLQLAHHFHSAVNSFEVTALVASLLLSNEAARFANLLAHFWYVLLDHALQKKFISHLLYMKFNIYCHTSFNSNILIPSTYNILLKKFHKYNHLSPPKPLIIISTTIGYSNRENTKL